jgi:hypothetical protein
VLDHSGQGELFILSAESAGCLPDKTGVFADEAGEGGLALLLKLAECKIAVDLVDVQLQAEDGVVFDGDVDKNIYVICKSLAGEVLEAGDAGGASAPCFRLYFGDEGIGGRVLFDQLKAVVVLFLPEGMACYVCYDPETKAPEGVVQRLGDIGGELGESYWLDQSKSLSGFGIKLRKAWKLALYFLLSSL